MGMNSRASGDTSKRVTDMKPNSTDGGRNQRRGSIAKSKAGRGPTYPGGGQGYRDNQGRGK